MSEWDAFPVAGGNQIDPRARELAIRTVLGEAANEPDDGQAAVAAVINNRLKSGRFGSDIPNVVLAKSQFEPWGTQAGRDRMYRYSADSPAYQKAAANVDRAFSGFDPTNGATHFFSPTAQAALGRPAPSWATGEPLNIGRHAFYAPEGRAQAAAASWDAFPEAPRASSPSQTSSPVTAEMPDTGGRFSDNPGQNFRVAREGVSEAAQSPLTISERLAKAWENPAPGGLMGIVKRAGQGAGMFGDALAGNISVTDDSGRTSPQAIQGMTDVAAIASPRPAPGGFGAAQFGPRVIEAQPAKAPVPTAQQLKTVAQEGFQSPAVKELEIAPRAMTEFGQGIRTKLNDAGIDENLAPKTFGVLKKLESVPEDAAAITGNNLQSLRRTFQNAAGTPDKTERLAAKQVIDAIDEFIPNVAVRDILSGDPKAAAQAWATARGNYAAAMRSEDIAKALIKAQRQAESAGSGANIDNATRQQFKAILNSDKKSRGFNTEELAAMEAAVKGTTWGNFARLIGKAAPTGIVSGGLAGGAGFAAGGPVGAVIVPIAGYIGKKLGDRSTANQVAKLDELVRSRAPLAKAMEDFGVKFTVIERDGQNPRTLSALALSARNLANNLKDAGVNLSPSEIMRAIQGPMRSAAEDDQRE